MQRAACNSFISVRGTKAPLKIDSKIVDVVWADVAAECND